MLPLFPVCLRFYSLLNTGLSSILDSEVFSRVLKWCLTLPWFIHLLRLMFGTSIVQYWKWPKKKVSFFLEFINLFMLAVLVCYSWELCFTRWLYHCFRASMRLSDFKVSLWRGPGASSLVLLQHPCVFISRILSQWGGVGGASLVFVLLPPLCAHKSCGPLVLQFPP